MIQSILLVEDDDNDAFFLERALKKAGVAAPIQRVRDGREAIDYFQGRGTFGDRNQFPLPDLVLLDLKLPQVMGLDVLKWIRGQEKFTSTVVAVFSASEHPDDIASSQQHGANAYLVKPSNLNLLDGIAKIIRDSWFNALQQSRFLAHLSNGSMLVQDTRGSTVMRERQ